MHMIFIEILNICVKIQKITFDEILVPWSTHLWPDRHSAIETHSAMTWPFEGDPEPIDMSIFDYEPTFWGVFINNDLVGVNSGHRTCDMHYRSRGLWVDPEHRSKGLAQLLFTVTHWQARQEKCEMVWSMPRQSALKSYIGFGFETVAGFFGTETSDSNIYVKLLL